MCAAGVRLATFCRRASIPEEPAGHGALRDAGEIQNRRRQVAQGDRGSR